MLANLKLNLTLDLNSVWNILLYFIAVLVFLSVLQTFVAYVKFSYQI